MPLPSIVLGHCASAVKADVVKADVVKADVSAAVCGDITDKKECKNECTWNTKKSKCESKKDAQK